MGKPTFIQVYLLRHEKTKYKYSTIEVKEPAICCHSHKRCDTKRNFDAQSSRDNGLYERLIDSAIHHKPLIFDRLVHNIYKLYDM